MKVAMTAQQARLLAYIDDYSVQHGTSPSFDEMTGFLGIASKSGIHRLVTKLEERGQIARLPNRARSIVVLGGKAGRVDSSVFPDAVEAKLRQMCADTGAARASVIAMAVAEFLGARS